MSPDESKSRSGVVGRTPAHALTRRDFLKASAGVAGAVALSGGLGGMVAACGEEGGGTGGGTAGTTLNWLTWPGHSTPEIIGKFEEDTGIKIKAKEYGAGDLGIVEISQNPGRYDVVTTSCEYIPQFVQADLLEELDPTEYAGWEDYFPEFQQDIGYNVEGKYYTILYEFGYLGLTYRQDMLSEADVESYEVLWDDRLRGKVGFQDWWGNSMGPISMYAGNNPANDRNPFQINNAQFEQLQETLFSLKPQVAGFYELAAIFTNFANGSIWAYPGGGDWVTQLLRDQGHPVASAIPKEGGVLWGEAISIVKGTEKMEAAKQFVDYCLSPHAQAQFAKKPSYSAIVPNMKAWEELQQVDPSWATRLQMTQFEDPNAITPWRDGRIAVRLLPNEQSIEEWQQVWEEFKAS